MPDNRRSTTRYAVALAAELKLQDESYDRTITNISLGGAFVLHEERLPIGTRVHISFRLPTREEAVSIGAAVRWMAEDGVGLQFDGLRAGEVWSMNQFLAGLTEAD